MSTGKLYDFNNYSIVLFRRATQTQLKNAVHGLRIVGGLIGGSKMTVKKFLETYDKRKKIYRDVIDYLEIIKHYKGIDEAEKIKNKQVDEIIGIKI